MKDMASPKLLENVMAPVAVARWWGGNQADDTSATPAIGTVPPTPFSAAQMLAILQ